MKKLHLVGFTTDNEGLILSSRKGAKSGAFVVAMDDELLSSIEEARRRRDGEEPLSSDDGKPGGALSKPADPSRSRPKSALSPREIQARLRAGSSTAEVAAQAGVDEEWVLRFADPILAEQARVVEGAQQLTLVKSRLGPSAEPLATAVQWNLTNRGVRFSDDVFAASWSAYNLHGTRWAVRFSYTSRQRRHTAEWEVDLRQRSLTALNRLAADLGHVEQGRRRPRLDPPDQPDAEPAPAASTGRGRGTARAKKAPSPRSSAATSKALAAKAGAATKTAAAAETAGAATAGASVKKANKAQRAVAAKAPAVGRAAKVDAVKPSPRQAGRPGKKAGEPAGSAAVKRSSTVKRSQRESSPRKTRTSKKPAPDSPAATSGEPGPPPADTYTERPSHLARPPSPMNMANRASALPGRRQGVPYRGGPPAAPERASPLPPRPPSRPTPAGQAPPTRDTKRAQAIDSPPPSAPAHGKERRPAATAARSGPGEGQKAPGTPPGAGAAAPFALPTGAPGPPPVAPPLPLQPAQAAASGDAERPSVVILSTPERPTTPEAPSGSFEIERPDQEWSRFAGQSRPAVVRVQAERADPRVGGTEEGEPRRTRGPRRARSD